MVIIERTPYKSIGVETNEEKMETISEGDEIVFVTENDGELKKGIVKGFKGSKCETVEIEFTPENCRHNEIWKVSEMVEGSLKLFNENNND